MKLIGKFLVLAFLFCKSSFVFSVPVSSEIPYEKRALIDELSVSQGDLFIDQELASGITSDIRVYLKNAEIEVSEDFFQIFNSVIQDVIHRELVLSGELQKLSYEIWEERFEANELKELIEFYKTPLGKKLVKVMPEVNQLSLEQTLELNQRIIPIIYYQLEKQLNEANIDIGALESNRGQFSKDKNKPTKRQLGKLRKKQCSDAQTSDKRVPVYTASPEYPYAARLFSIEGWVELAYVVRADGSTSSVRVAKTSTGTLFDAAAIEAVLRYSYCRSGSASKKKIRIRFELESNRKGQQNRAKRKNRQNLKGWNKGDFIESEVFKKEIKKYEAYLSRKAFAIANDGGNNWIFDWVGNYRTQAEANSDALTRCAAHKKRSQIKSVCKLLMVGADLSETFPKFKALENLAKSLHQKGYQPKSSFEQMEDIYHKKSQPKALALIEAKNGQFRYYYASNEDSQESANTIALDGCNDGKKLKYESDCRLYMIGDYLTENVPRLNQMRGIWEGQIESRQVVENPKFDQPDNISIKLDNCGAFPTIYTYASDLEKFKPFYRVLEVSEQAGNSVLSSVSSGKDWVETQVWTLIELSDNDAVVQWNRMVSNVDFDLDDDNREFGFLGSGRLKKLEGKCEALK